jgi:hypothetical protein
MDQSLRSLSIVDDAPQLHVLAFDGSDARRLTDETGVDDYAWYPDGRYLADLVTRDKAQLTKAPPRSQRSCVAP